MDFRRDDGDVRCKLRQHSHAAGGDFACADHDHMSCGKVDEQRKAGIFRHDYFLFFFTKWFSTPPTTMIASDITSTFLAASWGIWLLSPRDSE